MKFKTVLRKLLSPLSPIGTDFIAVIDALGKSFDRTYIFLNKLKTEVNPSTAIDTLPEWYEMLGLYYDPGLPLAELQRLASATYTSIDFPNFVSIQAKVNAVFSGINIEEIALYKDCQVGLAQCGTAFCGGYQQFFYYVVRGTVSSNAQLSQLRALLSRIVQAHLTPIYVVQVA